MRPPQVRHALTGRLRGSSDVGSFEQIFIKEEYSGLRDLREVSLILDLGANVGYSSIFFLNCFPSARVVAVEPDERNVAICRLNLKPYGNRAVLLHGAVWSERGKLMLSVGTSGDRREWATQVVAPADGKVGEIDAWDLDSIIEMTGEAQVDLLKIDVERSELAIFGADPVRWLPKVRNLCIELHGADCREVFFKAMSNFDFELEESGELTICRNVRARQ